MPEDGLGLLDDSGYGFLEFFFSSRTFFFGMGHVPEDDALWVGLFCIFVCV